jgi:hypothetical protein
MRSSTASSSRNITFKIKQNLIKRELETEPIHDNIFKVKWDDSLWVQTANLPRIPCPARLKHYVEMKNNKM